MPAECFIAGMLGPIAGPCEGPQQAAHLIPKQVIKREIRYAIPETVWDPRVWRPMCEKHHHALDYSKKVRLRREHIPAETEEYAAEHGLTWRLDRDYGLPA